MTFATFGDLKNRVLADTLRTDQAFGLEIPGFMQLAEQRMFYGDETGPDRVTSRVRVRDMETSETRGFVAGAASLPDRFLEPLALIWGRSQPSYATPEQFWVERSGTSPEPQLYTIEGSILRVWPALDGDARLVFVRRPLPLVADADTNWILTNAPGVYFHAVMIEAWRHLRNTQKQQEAATAYQASVAGLNRTETRARLVPTSMQLRSAFA
jgi:hypothetical protein